MSDTEPTLHDLFARWNALIEREAANPSLIPPPRSIEYDWQNTPTFAEFLATLPPHSREKAEVMHTILTRLNAYKPEMWVISEIIYHAPQLAYFLLRRHIELFILPDTFGIRHVSEGFRKHNQAPLEKFDAATRLQLNGATYEDVLAFARHIANYTLLYLISITDGASRYGDRIVAEHGRWLDALHEYMEDTVLQPPRQADDEQP
jgi:hypothetical protein